MIRWKSIVYNLAFALNCLLVFLLIFGDKIYVPGLLKVAGRMHPMVLHFPIVLLIIALVWETITAKKDDSDLKEAGNWILLLASFTAVIAALMGFFLSRESGYDTDAIFLHKWTGLAISLLSLCWYAFKETVRKKRVLTFTIGALSTAAIIMAGHQGATITHGDNFLLAPITADQLKPTVLLEDAIAYTHLIKPILEAKCISCHNSSKAKGELVMETPELLLKGGKKGKLWDTTAVGFGLMMQRVHLPMDEKMHMPPRGKVQLTDEEINALYYWIKGGSNFTAKIVDLPSTDTLRTVAASFFKTIEEDFYAFEPAKESIVKKLNNDYRVVAPLAKGSPALGVEFFGASFYKAEQLKELQAIADQVVSLTLNKMPVKNDDIKYIASLKNLRKLNLAFTQISGAALAQLKDLKELQQLSLAGTSVKAADLSVLKNLPKLSSLYIWNTNINSNDFTAIKKLFPTTTIGTGFRGDTVIVKLNSPIILGEGQIFTAATGVKLKHYIKGATLRYTLDGTEPDSLNSPVYKDSITITKTSILKTKAFLKGWGNSESVSKNYFKTGFLADSVKLITQPDMAYKGKGGSTLSNGEKGELNFRNEKWLGYKGNNLEALLYFKKPMLVSSVTFSTIIDIGSYIMPAAGLEVWGGTGMGNLVLLKKINPAQPVGLQIPYLTAFECAFEPRQLTLLKIVAKPVMKLPDWHPGKGQNGWVFIDELFLN
jgi:uncharacterized membrane protein